MKDELKSSMTMVVNGNAKLSEVEYGDDGVDMAKDALAVIEERDRLKTALESIANDPHCMYENSGGGQYGIGVADGHRCAASKARAALESRPSPDDDRVRERRGRE